MRRIAVIILVLAFSASAQNYRNSDGWTIDGSGNALVTASPSGPNVVNSHGLTVDSTGAVLVSLAGGASGTVTNVATTAPITGGPITTTGTIACATCATTTNGGALAGTANQIGLSAGGVISIASPLTIPGDTTLTQAANGDDMLFGKRNTDTGPTGNLINLQTQASGLLFRVSVNGSLNLNKGIATINNVATVGNPGVSATYGNISTTGNTAAITTATLCATTCPTGQYAIRAYIDSTVTCATPGPGTVGITLTWTDEAGTKSAVTLPMTVNGGVTMLTTMGLGNTTNEGSANFSLWSVTGNAIQYATTYTACTTGTGTYAIRLTASELQ